MTCDICFAVLDFLHRGLGRRAVQCIATEQVRLGMTGDGQPIVLVDVRHELEQAVSRIPNAIPRRQYESAPQHYVDQIVVPYCTIGGRSYLYTRKLLAKGIEARNYRESILGWIGNGLPLEAPDGKLTQLVHPYWRVFDLPKGYQAKT